MSKASLSIIFSSFMFIMFSLMAVQALQFQKLAKYFPLTISVAVALLFLLDLILQIIKLNKEKHVKTEMRKLNTEVIKYILWIVGYMVLILIVGFIAATIVYLFVFLKYETKFSILKSVITVSITTAIILVFGRVMNLFWPTGLFF